MDSKKPMKLILSPVKKKTKESKCIIHNPIYNQEKKLRVTEKIFGKGQESEVIKVKFTATSWISLSSFLSFYMQCIFLSTNQNMVSIIFFVLLA